MPGEPRHTREYWRDHGHALSPDNRSVAQCVLGAPASAAVLERDFCIAGQMVSRHRASLDPAYVEMLLFLRGAIDHIPREISKLTDEQAAAAIPRRLRDAATVNEVRVLYSCPEEDDYPEEEDDLDEGYPEESSGVSDRGGGESGKTPRSFSRKSPNGIGAPGSAGDGSGASGSSGDGREALGSSGGGSGGSGSSGGSSGGSGGSGGGSGALSSAVDV